MDLSVIIPVYNEQENLPVLYARLREAVHPLHVSAEYIFVDDGSSDRSPAILRELASTDPALRYITLTRNYGQQVALSAGLDRCTGEAIVMMDADLQDPPELIPELYAKLKQGNPIVYAKKISRRGNPLKKLSYYFFYRLLSMVSPIPIPTGAGDFRIISKQVARVLKQMPEQEKFLRGQIAWTGFSQASVEYHRGERMAGSPGYSWGKLFRLAFDGIFYFSNFPLRLATFAGLIVSGVSFVVILYALYSHYFLHGTPRGWTSIMISVLFIGGVQLLSIGIIGEYISRMSGNIRNRPLYIIKDTNITEDLSNGKI